MVPGTGIEPVQHQVPRDFKSLASTNSATRALFTPVLGIIYPFTKLLTGFEKGGFLRGYIHNLTILRVPGLSRIALPYGKTSKTANFHLLSILKSVPHTIENDVYYHFRIFAG